MFEIIKNIHEKNRNKGESTEGEEPRIDRVHDSLSPGLTFLPLFFAFHKTSLSDLILSMPFLVLNFL